MIIDKSLMFGEGASIAVTAGATGVLVGDVIDAAGVNADGMAVLGGIPLKAIAYIRSPVVMTSTDGTFELELRASSLAALTGGTTKVLWASGVLAEAVGVANYKIMDVQVPPMPDGTRYLGLWIKATTQAIDAGATIDAYLTTETPLHEQISA